MVDQQDLRGVLVVAALRALRGRKETLAYKAQQVRRVRLLQLPDQRDRQELRAT